MPADAANSEALTETQAAPVAREAPTAQQESQPGVPKKITNAQTVCNEKNAKGKLCNGHLKQLKTGGEESEKHLSGSDVRFKCQTCGTIYTGPPLGHVRDPEKQSRFVEKELTAILREAGGTLPVFKKSERGTLVPAEEPASHHAPPAAAPDAKPTAAAPAGAAKPTALAPAAGLSAASTSDLAPKVGPASLKPARPAASTSGTDSSPEADRHRPAAEAQAATGQASAAPLSAASATASPAAGAETVADLAPEASTELTPGAPPDERPKPESNAAAAEAPDKQEGSAEK